MPFEKEPSVIDLDKTNHNILLQERSGEDYTKLLLEQNTGVDKEDGDSAKDGKDDEKMFAFWNSLCERYKHFVINARNAQKELVDNEDQLKNLEAKQKDKHNRLADLQVELIQIIKSMGEYSAKISTLNNKIGSLTIISKECVQRSDTFKSLFEEEMVKVSDSGEYRLLEKFLNSNKVASQIYSEMAKKHKEENAAKLLDKMT
jgi:hypothetical protein